MISKIRPESYYPTWNEFYTRYEDVEKQMKEFDFSNDIVYCCSDGEESAFVKYFKQPGKCKELIYTSDDFRQHEDLFKRCDVVITNPPFSLKKELRDILLKYNLRFLLILPCICHFKISEKDVFWNRVNKFDGPNTRNPVCLFTSNFGTILHPYGLTYRERNGRDMPLTKELSTKVYKGYRKYGRRGGFNLQEDTFYVTVDSECAEFEYIGPYSDFNGSLVKWRR